MDMRFPSINWRQHSNLSTLNNRVESEDREECRNYRDAPARYQMVAYEIFEAACRHCDYQSRRQ